MIKLNSIVALKDGRKGKVAGRLENGEYILVSNKGGHITYFKEEDLNISCPIKQEMFKK